MDLQVVALPDAGEDSGDATAWAARLMLELSQLDDTQVGPLTGDTPNGAKGAGTPTGALLARLTKFDTLKALLEAARAWAMRTGRSVEVSLDGDTLKLTGASREQQQAVMDAFLARHPVA